MRDNRRDHRLRTLHVHDSEPTFEHENTPACAPLERLVNHGHIVIQRRDITFVQLGDLVSNSPTSLTSSMEYGFG